MAGLAVEYLGEVYAGRVPPSSTARFPASSSMSAGPSVRSTRFSRPGAKSSRKVWLFSGIILSVTPIASLPLSPAAAELQEGLRIDGPRHPV